MTLRWTECLNHILSFEGGYVDHPADPGGATNMGITRKTLARWRNVDPWWDLPKSEVQTLSRKEAADIYKALYWQRSSAQHLPPGLDLAVLDFAVNSGPVRAIKTLQALVAVSPDGFIGPITLAAVARRDTRQLIDALCDHRLRFLSRLKTFAVFGTGWQRRVAATRSAALKAVGVPDPDSELKGVHEMAFFDGYKTYIVAGLMLITGIAQTFGFSLPDMGDASGPQLVIEAFAIIFLRRGIKSDLNRS